MKWIKKSLHTYIPLIRVLGVVLSSEVNEYLIPVPSECHFIQAVQGHKVYLSRKEGICTQAIKFLKAKVKPDKDGYVEIYDKNRLWLRFKIKTQAE